MYSLQWRLDRAINELEDIIDDCKWIDECEALDILVVELRKIKLREATGP